MIVLCSAIECKTVKLNTCPAKSKCARIGLVCQEKIPFYAPHKLLVHGPALVQRLDRTLGCRMAEPIINQRRACFYFDGRRTYQHHRMDRPEAPWEMGHRGSTSHPFCHQSSASYKERLERFGKFFLKRDLFDPTEVSQNGEGD